MTREEAKQVLINTAFLLKDGTRFMKPEHEQQFREAYEKAIVALSQPEPCEDAVSRIDVLKGKVYHCSANGVEIIESEAVPVQYIKNLPSVTPKPRTRRS